MPSRQGFITAKLRCRIRRFYTAANRQDGVYSTITGAYPSTDFSLRISIEHNPSREDVIMALRNFEQCLSDFEQDKQLAALADQYRLSP